jgi:hypothetical protein
MKRYRIFAAVLGLLVIGGVIYASAGSMMCQACTPGFFKNHPEFITGSTCFTADQNTLVSSLFPQVDSCVGNLSLLGLLQSPTSVCGTGNTLAGGEVIMLRQGITRIMNATNSTPVGCGVAQAAINKANTTIADAIATENVQELKDLGQKFANLNDDNPCTIGQ